MRGTTTLIGTSALLMWVPACGSDDDSGAVLEGPTARGFGPTEVLVPTDERSPQRAETPPPPISGGTLLVTRDGKTIVAADPARDQVSVVTLQERALRHTIALEAGDEPGRVVEGPEGQVFVALRGSGNVATLDVDSGTATARRQACAAPRGIAVDAGRQQLHVACAEGLLVTLPLAGDESHSHRLVPNLRDVLVIDDRVLVSRLKSAQVLEVDLDASSFVSRRPHSVEQHIERFDAETGAFTLEPRTLAADGAFRMVAGGSKGVVLLHQLASTAPIELEREEPEEESAASPSPETGAGSAYGGGGAVPGMAGVSAGCDGIVHSAISQMTPAGAFESGLPIGRAVLSVDVAISPDQNWAAVAHAGARDPDAPTRIVRTPEGDVLSGEVLGGEPGRISVHDLSRVAAPAGVAEDCAPKFAEVGVGGQVTAVAFNPRVNQAAQQAGTWIVAQTREPAALHFIDNVTEGVAATVALSDESVRDTGHDLFHRDTGAGIACASCHLEGGDDGRVWHFDPIGPRRTQSVNVGLRGTEPFHWDGDMHNLGMLMEEVFVGRMGGVHQTEARLGALADWLFSLESLPPQLQETDPAAQRGRVLFESEEVGCASCHNGPVFTNSESYHVGTTEPGHRLQVPSLVGIGYRAPFLHTGCADSLADRFDPSCGGGDQHGSTSQLSAAQIEDLVAYLRTL